jgi:hypothetical protein
MTAEQYPPPVGSLLALGEATARAPEWPNYLELGLGPEHVPDLIRLASDRELFWAEEESDAVYGPIHAWRALGQLRAEAAVEPLIRAMANDPDSDWIGEEFPQVFASIGPAAIPALAAFLAESEEDVWSRITAVTSLEAVAKAHPDTRDAVVAAMTRQLAKIEENGPELNGFLINSLTDLGAAEAAPIMEQAFAAEAVDESIRGDWEEIQLALGLITERRTPRPRYFPLGLEPPAVEATGARRRPGDHTPQQARKARKKMAQASRRKNKAKKRK